VESTTYEGARIRVANGGDRRPPRSTLNRALCAYLRTGELRVGCLRWTDRTPHRAAASRHRERATPAAPAQEPHRLHRQPRHRPARRHLGPNSGSASTAKTSRVCHAGAIGTRPTNGHVTLGPLARISQKAKRTVGGSHTSKGSTLFDDGTRAFGSERFDPRRGGAPGAYQSISGRFSGDCHFPLGAVRRLHYRRRLSGV